MEEIKKIDRKRKNAQKKERSGEENVNLCMQLKVIDGLVCMRVSAY